MANVHELTRSFPNAMAPDQPSGRTVEDELRHAVAVADDGSPGVVPERCTSDDDVDTPRASVLLGEAHAADLRDRVHAIRELAGVVLDDSHLAS